METLNSIDWTPDYVDAWMVHLCTTQPDQVNPSDGHNCLYRDGTGRMCLVGAFLDAHGLLTDEIADSAGGILMLVGDSDECMVPDIMEDAAYRLDFWQTRADNMGDPVPWSAALDHARQWSATLDHALRDDNTEREF